MDMAGRDAPAFFSREITCGDILCQLRQVIKNIEPRFVKLSAQTESDLAGIVKQLYNYNTPLLIVKRKSSISNRITVEQRARVFKALADPTRLRIVEMLADKDEMCGSEIADKLGISLALLCHHWNTLEHAGVISKRKAGQTASISLNEELLADCLKGLID
jgi:DNA-binding transcriptional ArsR family regulator